MDVSGKTKITGIFGHPIGHTLSPAMHNAAFKKLGIDMCYIAFDVLPADLPDAVLAIKSLNMTGVDRKSTRLNSSHIPLSRMPSSA